MQEELTLQCPWCRETVTVWLAVDDIGEMVIDCEVCCRPWRVVVRHDPTGGLQATIDRS